MKGKRVLSITLTVIVICLLASAPFAEDTSVSIYAGNGKVGYKDGGVLEAAFNQPYGITVDGDGSMIVVDMYNNRIRRVSGGKVTTIAGYSDETDSFGYPLGGLVDGKALESMFNRPRDAVVNSNGDIYISDTGNNVIRIITGGKVYTFAGNGKPGYVNGSGNKAEFNMPSGIDIDKSGNIYVADSLNNVIRKITPDGQVSTYAGRYSKKGGYIDGTASSAMFNEPSDIAVDPGGALYVLDSGNQLVRKIDNGMVTTLAGLRDQLTEGTEYAQGGFADGKGEAARFNFPKGIALTDGGLILVADSWNHRIRAINPDGRVVTVAGSGLPGLKNGSPSDSGFDAPVDILAYEGKVYVSDMWNNCIRVLTVDDGLIKRTLDRAELLEKIDTGIKTEYPQVWFGSTRIVFPDEKPYISDGSIYLPLRFIFEAWGADVKWIAPAKHVEVTKGSFHTTFMPGQDITFFNGERTFVKAEDIASVTGLRVEWFPEYNCVIVAE
ncbi:MAG: stalk domain-containing protein [Acetivibrionales bacterium]